MGWCRKTTLAGISMDFMLIPANVVFLHKRNIGKWKTMANEKLVTFWSKNLSKCLVFNRDEACEYQKPTMFSPSERGSCVKNKENKRN